MADKLVSTRDAFGKALANIKNKDVVVIDADVCSSTKTNAFKDKYPDRFIEVGIAEADMIGTAAGLASCGKIAVASSFAAFATGRCYDQIRSSVAYPELNVKIVGTHAGITVGEDGATHQMLEDINLMRGLPNMVVLSPSDDVATEKLVKEMIDYEGPVYMRISRMETKSIYTNKSKFEIGKSHQIGMGSDATIFATGEMVQIALEAKDILAENGIDIRVVDLYSIKPIDKKMIVKCAEETENLYTLEDHSIIGGIGSAVAEVLSEEYPKKVTRFGMNDEFGRSGTGSNLLTYFELDTKSIAEKIYNDFDIEE